jgi:hypothetical protein
MTKFFNEYVCIWHHLVLIVIRNYIQLIDEKFSNLESSKSTPIFHVSQIKFCPVDNVLKMFPKKNLAKKWRFVTQNTAN